MNTKRAGILLGCALLAGPGLAAAPTEEGANPYTVISERNVFHLNPIPPPPEPEKPKVDLPVIKLSGFFKVGGQTRALFSSEPKKKDQGWIYYNLAEGEKDKDGLLAVVKIDAENGKVDILNSGTPATLSLKDDSLAPAPAAAAAAPPHPNEAPPGPFAGRAPAMPGMPVRQPIAPGGASSMPPGFPGANGANVPNPMRPRRLPVTP
jgi:hypothetical protein